MERKNDAVADLLKTALSKPCDIYNKPAGQPVIAIVNSFMELSPGDMHLGEVSRHVRRGIVDAGGFPVEMHIPGACGEMKRNANVRKYYFAFRDFTTAMVEFLLSFHEIDGAVFLCTCDNQVPAFVMGALRVNLPCVFVTGGYMRPGIYEGRQITAFSVAKEYGRLLAGEAKPEEVDRMLGSACPTAGACPEMGTANTMGILTEALGLTLPGCAGTPAGSEQQHQLAYCSGRAAVRCVEQNLRPRDIVDQNALENMIQVCLAIGGSTNAVIHSIAYAKEIEAPVTLDTWGHLSKSTPLICAISPNQKGYYMPHFAACGGTGAVMQVLGGRLSLDGPCVGGGTMRQQVSQAAPIFGEVLRPLENPFSEDGGLVVLKGNLAKNGGVLKKSAIAKGLDYFKGKARVYDREEDAMQGVLNEEVRPGDVVVVRYEGPSAGPGSREVVSILHVLAGKGMSDAVAVVTDGRMSGTNLGLAICNISPEAITGSPLAVVETDDEIEIDIAGGAVNLLVPQEIISLRLATWKPPKPEITKGLLGLYAKNVGQLSDGARIT